MVLKGYGVQQEGVMIEFAIRTDGLAKSFGQTQALRDVSLQVPTGSIICVLGRNGAGKTTTVRILTTLIQPDEGVAEVAGFDTASQPQRVRARIGVAGQGTTLDQLLTGRQNLEVIGRLYHLGAARSRERAEELLKEFGLTEAAGRQVKTYSGGMRRRLDLAASLLPDPQVLFLDEPTTGLDPISRTALWQTIRDYAARGTTVLLTTQDMEEANQLADNIVVLAGGVIVARGTPAELAAATGQPRIRVSLPEARPEQVKTVLAVLGPEAEARGRIITTPASDGIATLVKVVQRLAASGIEVHDVGLEHPTLNEVFAALTTHPADGTAKGTFGGPGRLHLVAA
jgi:ABC-2 type transport system ATP-binding protein